MSEDLPQTIGIDISKAALDCHVHPAGIDRQFPNTARGHTALIAWAGKWQVERIAYEAKRQCTQRLEQIARHIAALDAEIAAVIAADEKLARRHHIITSIAGLGTLTANQIIATMPELGSLDNKQAASLAGLAPVARQSGQWKGKSFIRGGRANVRQALYMPALVAARFNPDLKAKYQQLVAAGKLAKIAITAVMRKLVVTANALLKTDRLWTPSRP